MRVCPLPGGISSNTVPLDSLKFLVLGKNWNNACSPTRAKEPSLKRKSAKEALPVDSPSPGISASAGRAGRLFLLLLGINCTKLRKL